MVCTIRSISWEKNTATPSAADMKAPLRKVLLYSPKALAEEVGDKLENFVSSLLMGPDFDYNIWHRLTCRNIYDSDIKNHLSIT